jgi:hypothetical protein
MSCSRRKQRTIWLNPLTLRDLTDWTTSVNYPTSHYNTDIKWMNFVPYNFNKPYFFFIILGGVRLSSLCTAATTGLLYQPQMIHDGDCGTIGGLNIGRGNRSTQRKPAPVPHCPPQIPHDQTRAWTQASAVGSQRLTTSAMALPALFITKAVYVWVQKNSIIPDYKSSNSSHLCSTQLSWTLLMTKCISRVGTPMRLCYLK